MDEAQQGKLENNTPFFHDYHFFEVLYHTYIYSFFSSFRLFKSSRLFFSILQNKMKELELLCSLKEVPLDFNDLENVVLALRFVIEQDLKPSSLTHSVVLTHCSSAHREKFFQEVNMAHIKDSTPLAKTKTLVRSLMNRSELLLHVTIAPHCRSLTSTPAGTSGTGEHLILHILICKFFKYS